MACIRAMKWMVMQYLLIGLQMVDQIIDSVYALLYSEVELVMLCAKLMSHLPSSHEVWGSLDANAEGMQWMRPIKGVLGFLQMPAQHSSTALPWVCLCSVVPSRLASFAAVQSTGNSLFYRPLGEKHDFLQNPRNAPSWNMGCAEY